jgi:iron complex transport system substrate-binding protein
MRIVSLLSSTTEIVFALGLGDDLVGVTFECDFPPDARVGRTILVGGMATAGLTAGEIDAAVRASASSNTAMYELDEAAFAACDAELVLTQDLCRVCALPSGDVDVALAHLGCQATVVSHDPHTLGEVLNSIEAIATAAGVADRGRALTANLRTRLNSVVARVAGLPRRKVFVLEWTDPPFLAGHWVPDLVNAAGGKPVLALAGERSVATTWEAIAEADPDIIIVAPCGFELEQAGELAVEVLDHLPPRATVWAIDANSFIVRPGPRLIDGVEHLAAIIHGIEVTDPTAVRQVR